MFVYVFKQDIDLEAGIDCKRADALVRKLIVRAEDAVQKSGLDDLAKGFLQRILPLFRQTHDSIRVLCKELYEAHGHTGDALSLVREQIEKLFVLQLVCEDSGKWVPVYLKHGWREKYALFLHEKAEVENLPGFQQSIQHDGPYCLEQLRLAYGVTEDEMNLVELECAGQPIPPGLKAHRLPSFPTPGTALPKMKDPNRRTFMKRWNVEYRRYCSFSHILSEKVVLNQVQTHGHRVDPMMRTDYLNKNIEPGLVVSYLAIASAVAEVNTLIGQDLDVLDPLSELWEMFRPATLLGMAFWDMRVKQLMPQLIGALP